MRTTIRIPDEHRDTLLRLAAERGDRGCTKIVQDALAHYLTYKERGPEPLVHQPLPAESLPETRAQRLWTVIGWVWEEAAGFAGVARTLRARLRRSSPSMN